MSKIAKRRLSLKLYKIFQQCTYLTEIWLFQNAGYFSIENKFQTGAKKINTDNLKNELETYLTKQLDNKKAFLKF